MTYNKNNNYLFINRSITEGMFWLTDEKFSGGHAWIDLLILANWKQSTFTKRTHSIIVERGQLAWSKKALSDRWNWSQAKVTRFLSRLEKEGMANIKTTPLTTLITITNYDKYQLGGDQTKNTPRSNEDCTETYKERQERQECKEQVAISDSEGQKNKTTPMEIFDLWVIHVKKTDRMPTPRTLTTKIRDKIITRLNSHGWAEDFATSLEKLPLGKFGTGNDWQPNLEWMVKAKDNVGDLIGGKFDFRNEKPEEKVLTLTGKKLENAEFLAKLLNNGVRSPQLDAISSRGEDGSHFNDKVRSTVDLYRKITVDKTIDNPVSWFCAVIDKKDAGS